MQAVGGTSSFLILIDLFGHQSLIKRFFKGRETSSGRHKQFLILIDLFGHQK
jgi:extradiol dioxygenase family protein